MTTFNKKAITFKKMSLQFSINSSKYVHFWTLFLNTILILIKFLFQRYISCRNLNFDTKYEIWCHGYSQPSWKSGLVDDFAVCTKIFLEIIGSYKNVKQKFSLDSKVLTGLYYRAWTNWFTSKQLLSNDVSLRQEMRFFHIAITKPEFINWM